MPEIRDPEKLTASFETAVAHRDLGRLMGKLLTGMLMPALEPALEAENCASHAGKFGSAWLRLAAYHADHGGYPESLNALAEVHQPPSARSLHRGAAALSPGRCGMPALFGWCQRRGRRRPDIPLAAVGRRHRAPPCRQTADEEIGWFRTACRTRRLKSTSFVGHAVCIDLLPMCPNTCNPCVRSKHCACRLESRRRSEKQKPACTACPTRLRCRE